MVTTNLRVAQASATITFSWYNNPYEAIIPIVVNTNLSIGPRDVSKLTTNISYDPLPGRMTNYYSGWLKVTFTTPVNAVTFDTNGSDYDTMLAIYTGTSYTLLTNVTWDDDSGTDWASSFTIDVTEPTTYWVEITSFNNYANIAYLNITSPNFPLPIRYNGYGLAGAYIGTFGWAQATFIVVQTVSPCAQALAWIIPPSTFAQAEAFITAVVITTAQAEASILPGTIDGDIIRRELVGHAQATINRMVFHCIGLARTLIVYPIYNILWKDDFNRTITYGQGWGSPDIGDTSYTLLYQNNFIWYVDGSKGIISLINADWGDDFAFKFGQNLKNYELYWELKVDASADPGSTMDFYVILRDSGIGTDYWNTGLELYFRDDSSPPESDYVTLNPQSGAEASTTFYASLNLAVLTAFKVLINDNKAYVKYWAVGQQEPDWFGSYTFNDPIDNQPGWITFYLEAYKWNFNIPDLPIEFHTILARELIGYTEFNQGYAQAAVVIAPVNRVGLAQAVIVATYYGFAQAQALYATSYVTATAQAYSLVALKDKWEEAQSLELWHGSVYDISQTLTYLTLDPTWSGQDTNPRTYKGAFIKVILKESGRLHWDFNQSIFHPRLVFDNASQTYLFGYQAFPADANKSYSDFVAGTYWLFVYDYVNSSRGNWYIPLQLRLSLGPATQAYGLALAYIYNPAAGAKNIYSKFAQARVKVKPIPGSFKALAYSHGATYYIGWETLASQATPWAQVGQAISAGVDVTSTAFTLNSSTYFGTAAHPPTPSPVDSNALRGGYYLSYPYYQGSTSYWPTNQVGPWSLEFWVNLQDTSLTGANPASLIRLENGTIFTIAFSAYNNVSNAGDWLTVGYVDATTSTQYSYSVMRMPVGSWGHLVFTSNASGTLKVYYNGSLAGTINNLKSADINYYHYIKQSTNVYDLGPIVAYNGTILTDAQIAQHYRLAGVVGGLGQAQASIVPGTIDGDIIRRPLTGVARLWVKREAQNNKYEDYKQQGYAQARTLINIRWAFAQTRTKIRLGNNPYKTMVLADGATHHYGIHAEDSPYTYTQTYYDEIGVADSTDSYNMYASQVSSPVGPERIGTRIYSGNSYINWNQTNLPEISSGNPFTIEGWFGFDSYTPIEQHFISLRRSASPYHGFTLSIGNGTTNGSSGDKLQFSSIVNNVATVSTTGIVISQQWILQWYHVAIAWTGTEWKVYINGELKITAAGTWIGDSSPISGYLYLNYDNNGGGYSAASGIWDNISIYPTALSGVIIAQHASYGLPAFAQAMAIINQSFGVGCARALNIRHATTPGYLEWIGEGQAQAYVLGVVRGDAQAQALIYSRNAIFEYIGLSTGGYAEPTYTTLNALTTTGASQVEPNYYDAKRPTGYPRNDNWGMKWVGYFTADQTGQWKFFTSTDDGSRVDVYRVSDNVLMGYMNNNWGGGQSETYWDSDQGNTAARYSSPINLVEGERYYFIAKAINGSSAWVFRVGYKRPNDNQYHYLMAANPPWVDVGRKQLFAQSIVIAWPKGPNVNYPDLPTDWWRINGYGSANTRIIGTYIGTGCASALIKSEYGFLWASQGGEVAFNDFSTFTTVRYHGWPNLINNAGDTSFEYDPSLSGSRWASSNFTADASGVWKFRVFQDDKTTIYIGGIAVIQRTSWNNYYIEGSITLVEGITYGIGIWFYGGAGTNYLRVQYQRPTDGTNWYYLTDNNPPWITWHLENASAQAHVYISPAFNQNGHGLAIARIAPNDVNIRPGYRKAVLADNPLFYYPMDDVWYQDYRYRYPVTFPSGGGTGGGGGNATYEVDVTDVTWMILVSEAGGATDATAGFAEVEAYNLDSTNLIRYPNGGSATYSASTYYDANYVPSKAADGNTGSDWAGASAGGVYQWWRVDFTVPQTIKSIKIYNRQTYYTMGKGAIMFGGSNADTGRNGTLKTIISRGDALWSSHGAGFNQPSPSNTGGAIDFNDRYATVTSQGDPSAIASYITVEAWVNWSGQDSEMIWGTGTIGSSDYYDIISRTGGWLGVNTGSGDTWGAQVLTANQWVHIAVVLPYQYDGTTGDTNVKIYKNGILQSLSWFNTARGSVRALTETFRIGLWPQDTNSSYIWSGNMDEFAIFGYELSAVQILAHYQSVQGFSFGLARAVQWYKDETTGALHKQSYANAEAKVFGTYPRNAQSQALIVRVGEGFVRWAFDGGGAWDNYAEYWTVFGQESTQGMPLYNDANPIPGFDGSWGGAAWVTRFIADESGSWSFRILVDDGADLWINDTRVVDAGWTTRFHGADEWYSGSMSLTSTNEYVMKIRFGEGNAPYHIQVEYKRPTDSSWYALTDSAPPWLPAWIYRGHAQAVAYLGAVKQTINQSAQAEAWIKIRERGYAQAEPYIKAIVSASGFACWFVGHFQWGQAAATIKATTSKRGYAEAFIGHFKFGLAKASIRTVYQVVGYAETFIGHFKFGLARTRIRATYVGIGLARALLTRAAIAQAGAHIKQTYPLWSRDIDYSSIAQASSSTEDDFLTPAFVLDGNPETVCYVGEGVGSWIKLDLGDDYAVNGYKILPAYYDSVASLQYSFNNSTWYTVVSLDLAVGPTINLADTQENQIPQVTARYWRLYCTTVDEDSQTFTIATFELGYYTVKSPTFAQGLALVGAWGQARAQAYISPAFGWSRGQAKARIVQVYYVTGLAETLVIPPTYFGLAQADILATDNKVALAQTWIIPPSVFGWAQASIFAKVSTSVIARATIKQHNVSCRGNAQAKITRPTGHAQAEATIKSQRPREARPFGQARALVGHFQQGLAATQIIKSAGYAQATLIIMHTRERFAQAVAFITRNIHHAQAQAMVVQIYRGYGLAGALYAQYLMIAYATATILTTYNCYAQANARILKVSQMTSQAQAITIYRYVEGFGQAKLYVIKKVVKSGLAQAQIGAFKMGQAIAYIWAYDVPRIGLAQGYILANINIRPPLPTSDARTYLVRFNGLDLPGYAQSESYDSVMNIYSDYAAYIDASLSEYIGLENKSINLRMKLWEPTYSELKTKAEYAATILRSVRGRFGQLYVHYYDRYYLVLPKSMSISKAAGESVSTLDYDITFEAKPWLLSNEIYSASGTGELVVPRGLAEGGWTPTIVTVSGTDISITGTAMNQSTGSITLTGGPYTNAIIDTENFTAMEGSTSLNNVINKDFALYLGPGTTTYTITGATSCIIQWQNRWYL